jgi:phosphatidylserine/phosphatidylglycerophosphate/cardiolipin synthase-like enzyme
VGTVTSFWVKSICIGACLSLGVPSAYSSSLQVSFNYNPQSSYTEPYRNVSRSGDDLEAVLISKVRSAKSSLLIAVQEIRLPELAKAIAQKHREGVQVRVILENSYNYDLVQIQEENFDKSPGYHGERNQEYFRFADINGDGKISQAEALERDAVYILKSAGVPIIDDTADGSAGSGLMHHKFVVVDSSRVAVSTANFTMSDIHGDYSNINTRGNANSLMSFDSVQLAQIFEEEFSIMWGTSAEPPRFGVQKPYRGPETVKLSSGEEVTVQFAGTSRRLSDDQSTVGLISRALKQTKKSVSMALFVYSEAEISEALRKISERRTISIRGLIEPTFAFRYYSKALDMWGLQLLPENCRPHPGSTPWQSPVTTVGVPQITKGDFLHHKFAVVDSEVTIMGSHNWSRAATSQNDETLMVIKSESIAVAYEQEFESWYQTARLGAPQWLVKAASESQRRCN